MKTVEYPLSADRERDFLFARIGGLLETLRTFTVPVSEDPSARNRQDQTENGHSDFTDEEKRAILEQAAEVRRVSAELVKESRLIHEEINNKRLGKKG
jgi:hypothetical protein